MCYQCFRIGKETELGKFKILLQSSLIIHIKSTSYDEVTLSKQAIVEVKLQYTTPSSDVHSGPAYLLCSSSCCYIRPWCSYHSTTVCSLSVEIFYFFTWKIPSLHYRLNMGKKHRLQSYLYSYHGRILSSF